MCGSFFFAKPRTANRTIRIAVIATATGPSQWSRGKRPDWLKIINSVRTARSPARCALAARTPLRAGSLLCDGSQLYGFQTAEPDRLCRSPLPLRIGSEERQVFLRLRNGDRAHSRKDARLSAVSQRAAVEQQPVSPSTFHFVGFAAVARDEASLMSAKNGAASSPAENATLVINGHPSRML